MKRLGEQAQNFDHLAWNNRSAEIVKNYTCHIPAAIHTVIRSGHKALPTDEFSFLLKATVDHASQKIVLTGDWYYPKQLVGYASVDYLEDVPEYNGVLHKHPGKLRTFSGTDDKWINQNFEFSLLWIDDEFCGGIINIPIMDGGRIQLPVTCTCDIDAMTLDEAIKLLKDESTKSGLVVLPFNIPKTAATVIDKEIVELVKEKSSHASPVAKCGGTVTTKCFGNYNKSIYSGIPYLTNNQTSNYPYAQRQTEEIVSNDDTLVVKDGVLVFEGCDDLDDWGGDDDEWLKHWARGE